MEAEIVMLFLIISYLFASVPGPRQHELLCIRYSFVSECETRSEAAFPESWSQSSWIASSAGDSPGATILKSPGLDPLG